MPRKGRVVLVIGTVIGWLGAAWLSGVIVAAILHWLGVGPRTVALKWLLGSGVGWWPFYAAIGCQVAGALLEAWGKRLGRTPSA